MRGMQQDIYIRSVPDVPQTEADNNAIREFWKAISRYRASENGGDRLKVHLVLRNQAMVNALRRLPLEEVLARNVELYAYTVEDLWSMEVLGVRLGQPSLLEREPIAADSDSVIHLVIFGASAQAESLALHTALVSHYPNYCRDHRLRTRITWVSDKMEDFSRFRQQYSRLLENSFVRDVYLADEDVRTGTRVPKYINEREDFVDVEWEFVQGRSYDGALRYKLAKWDQDGNRQLTVALCYDDDARNENESLGLPLGRGSQSVVLVCTADDAALGLLKHSGEFANMITIGCRDFIFPDLGEFIRMGQYVNYAYCKMRQTTVLEQENGAAEMAVAIEVADKDQVIRAWNKSMLSTSKIWSNIYNAFTVNGKLRSLGIPLESLDRLFALTDRAVEMMAEVEHNRWSVEELILGYEPTSDKEHEDILSDFSRKNHYKGVFKHDDLRSYSSLGIDDTGLPVTRYDVGLVRSLPLIAHAAYIQNKRQDG